MNREELDRKIEEIRRELEELKKKRQQIEVSEIKIKGDIKEIDVKKAVIIETPEGNQRGIISLWEDGKVTACIGDEKGEGSCYTTEEKGDHMFYIFQAFAAGLGYRVKSAEDNIKEETRFK